MVKKKCCHARIRTTFEMNGEREPENDCIARCTIRDENVAVEWWHPGATCHGSHSCIEQRPIMMYMHASSTVYWRMSYIHDVMYICTDRLRRQATSSPGRGGTIHKWLAYTIVNGNTICRWRTIKYAMHSIHSRMHIVHCITTSKM